MGLAVSRSIAVLILHLKPALPWPKLGLIWDVPFTSEGIMGFITYFFGSILGSNSLPTPCTSGKLMPLDLACDLV